MLTFCGLLLLACGNSNTATPITAIQGDGDVSPLEDQDVRIAGVVTGDFQSNDADTQSSLRGFYVQGEPDGRTETSDGVFVFDGNAPAVDVNVGDRVAVTGTVTEFFGETQVAAKSVRIIGSGTIVPTSVEFPRPHEDLEPFEGMLIRIPQPMTVASARELERYGEILR